MAPTSEPEIRRVPLEEICLSILAGSFSSSCMDFLLQTPQPPTEQTVTSALVVLREVGAITLAEDKPKVISGEALTPLGHHLAKLPVDVRLGKMLIFGALFNCFDPVLTVAASLSCQSPFSSFVNDALEAKARHKAFADSESDFVTYCNLWDQFQKAQSKGHSEARRFCNANYLKWSVLQEVSETRKHFKQLLSGIGFIESADAKSDVRSSSSESKSGSSLSSNAYSNNTDVIHAIICAGLYPNVACVVRSPNDSIDLWHKQEQLHFHSSSVNAKVGKHCHSSWVAFHSKFGTQSRVWVSTTAFVHPFAILLFGGSIEVKYTERKVIVDDWIILPMAAQSSVMFRKLRMKMDRMLEGFLKRSRGSEESLTQRDAIVKGIVDILVS